jgi:hypothetical protein
MANCATMKQGDIYKCKTCGLELKVSKSCACIAGKEISCTSALQCCGEDMTKK